MQVQTYRPISPGVGVIFDWLEKNISIAPKNLLIFYLTKSQTSENNITGCAVAAALL